MSDEDSKREYEAMLALDDAIGELIDCGWTDTDLRERVDTTIEDVRSDN